MRTNKIREYITNKFKALGYEEVYYKNASNNATFPYIVYDLKSHKNGVSTWYDFEVNLWGNGSQAEMEDLADQIEYEFEKDLNLSENGLLTFNWLSRGNIDDPNKDLKRVMIKFDMKYFK